MSYIGNEPIVSATRTITEIVATAGQTVFVANGGYTVGFIDVFVNGAQLQTNDFTATNGSSITLNSGASLSDDIRLVAWGTFSTASVDGSVINTASIPLAKLSATGTPSSSNYLRGDNTWASVASSQWTTTGSDIYYTTGSAGIGNSSPQDTLHVQGISRIQSTAGAACYWRYDNTVNSGGKIWRWGDGISAHGTFSLYNQTDGAFVLNATSTGNLQFNSGYGSAATAYGCRAWVNFNGTGTVAIRGSGNVSSITDNGTGQYTINFTTAMPDTNYSVSMGGITNTSGGGRFTNGPETSTPTTSAFRIICTQSGVGSVDFEYAYFQVFR